MAKLTPEEASNCEIIRATFEGGKWTVLVSDESYMIYRVYFDGNELDENTVLLSKTHQALLTVDKHEPVVIPEPIVRDELNGLNPTN